MLHSYIDIPLDSFTQVYTVLSLPELKAQVSFSDCLLSLCKLFTFSSSPEQLSPPPLFQPNLTISILLVMGNPVCSNERQHPFPGRKLSKLQKDIVVL